MSHGHPIALPRGLLEPLAHDVVATAVGLLLGGAALHVAAVAVYHDDSRTPTVDRAIVTALLGAAVWSLLASVPYVGVALALAGWLGVVHLRYPGRLERTGVVAVLAVAGATVVALVLATVGADVVAVMGVPSV